MATIGLSHVHFALLVEDPAEGTPTYDAPMRIVGAITANINPNSSSNTLFADDGPSDTAATMGEISLELNVKDIPPATMAILLGHTYEQGVLRKRGADSPVWVALGFKSLKTNGTYRHVWLTKGKFALPEEAYQTRGDSIEFNTPTITGAFVKRDCDDQWLIQADEDDPQVGKDTIEKWFEGPNVPLGGGTIKPKASTVTVSGTTFTVRKTQNITLTAKVLPSAADQEVTWTSLDPLTATVDENSGQVTGVKAGIATIRATTKAKPQKSGQRTITVTD